jgi:hypothetical protein
MPLVHELNFLRKDRRYLTFFQAAKYTFNDRTSVGIIMCQPLIEKRE